MKFSQFLTDHMAQFVILVTEQRVQPSPEKIHAAIMGVALLAWSEGRADGLDASKAILDSTIAEVLAELKAVKESV